MIYGISIGLSVLCIYFAIRFYGLSRGIHNAKIDLEETIQQLEQNRTVKCSIPNKELEELLIVINENLLMIQKERIQFSRREQSFRKQIENMSHDLRTPLTSMIGYVELIDASSLDQEDQEFLQIISRKAKTLEHFVRSFYDLSRLELNDFYYKFAKVDLHKCLNETILGFYQDFEDQNLQVTMETGEKPIFVFCDESALERIYVNLIQNTLRYASTYLKVSLEKEAQVVRIIFENDATTLQQEDMERLFEPFYVKDQARTSESTGLGLTITKHLTEQMGGKIEAGLENNRFQIRIQFSIKS